jgi:ABC-type phosphate/phosphonate transport system substrate-binding protein
VVVRADDPRETLAGFRGARLALNGRDSQSGWGAMLHHVAPMADRGRFFGSAEVTGAHAGSVARVAEGVADIAAVDWVSWRMALAFRPEAARLRVLMLTEPTPALPLIAAAGADLPRYRAATGAALEALDAGAKAALGLAEFVPLAPGDYAVIAERAQAARRRLVRDPAL